MLQQLLATLLERSGVIPEQTRERLDVERQFASLFGGDYGRKLPAKAVAELDETVGPTSRHIRNDNLAVVQFGENVGVDPRLLNRLPAIDHDEPKPEIVLEDRLDDPRKE